VQWIQSLPDIRETSVANFSFAQRLLVNAPGWQVNILPEWVVLTIKGTGKLKSDWNQYVWRKREVDEQLEEALMHQSE
tara:strand:- start:388 stop:621 length:234 start_codon:yes stop_codon:yes gene_type:complete